ncbi:MAG: helix-turn-helix domain-containing protein, partial [Acidimicrobiales bacterium]
MKNQVREQRGQRGLSQADVAAGLGVSRQTV